MNLHFNTSIRILRKYHTNTVMPTLKSMFQPVLGWCVCVCVCVFFFSSSISCMNCNSLRCSHYFASLQHDSFMRLSISNIHIKTISWIQIKCPKLSHTHDFPMWHSGFVIFFARSWLKQLLPKQLWCTDNRRFWHSYILTLEMQYAAAVHMYKHFIYISSVFFFSPSISNFANKLNAGTNGVKRFLLTVNF